MTKETLTQYRKQALAHSGRAATIILELLDELELRGQFRQLGRKLLPVCEDDPWPYCGEHQGKPIWEVPDEFLREWASQRSRKSLRVDADLALAAQLDLKLYDHIQARIKLKEQQAQTDGSISKTENTLRI